MTARSVLGMIHRHFKNLNPGHFLMIYKTYVRPHLEYCIQSYSPWLKKDIEELERVQRRATKMVAGFHKLKYHERLKRLNLTTLEKRRTRGDLIETYKLLTGKEDINYRKFFQMNINGSNLRGHDKKLFKGRCRLEIRRNFFSQRVVDNWNSLPQEVIDAESVNGFKRMLDKYLDPGL